MDLNRRFVCVVFAVSMILVPVIMATGCGGGSGGNSGGKTTESKNATLTIFAASSLTDAFGELGKKFEKQNPGVKVRQSFTSSSTLLSQLQQGAPADVFASATEEMDTTKKDGLIADKPEIFVKNREVTMVPKDNPANIQSFKDMGKPGIKLTLAEDGVPAADYAMEILGKANAEYGKDFKKDVLSNVVSREADVRSSVTRVVLGEADATFGYASDYTPDIRGKVKVVKIPPNLNIVATYPIAALKDSKHPALARKWVKLVVSDEGQRVLKKWNFEPAAK